MQTPVNNPPAMPVPDKDTVTRFFEAARTGDDVVLEALLAQHPSLVTNNQSATGATALIIAAGAGRLEAVWILQSKGADIHAADNGDQSALFYAGLHGEQNVAEYLISQGVDPAAKNRSGISPIDIANASDFHALGENMKRERAEYVARQFDEAWRERLAEQKALRDNIQQVTEIVGSGLSADVAAPAKAAFRKPKITGANPGF